MGKLGYRRGQILKAYFFVLPVLALVAIFIFVPMIATFIFSLLEYDGIRTPHFIGWNNFLRILRDPLTWKSLRVTIYYLIGTLPIAIALGFLLANVLVREWLGKAQSLFLSSYFVPYVLSYVAVGFLWAWLLDPLVGVVNYFLSLVGVAPQAWMRDPVLAMPSIWLIATWKHLGFFLVMYIAAVQSVPEVYYEAARVDGIRTWWQEIRYITWPLTRPTTFFLTAMGFIGAMSVFDIVYVTTKGGPANLTKTVVIKIYEDAFIKLRFGEASATTIILLLIMLFGIYYQWKYYTSILEK